MPAFVHRVRRSRRRYLNFQQYECRRLLTGFTPTGAEQAFLEQLNDARANPPAYGASIGVDLSGVVASPPLAFDGDLIESARLHSQDMNNQNYFDHVSPQGVTPQQRVAATGYPGSYIAESIAAGRPDAAETLADLIIDTGTPSLGHRRMLLSIDSGLQSQTQVGVGTVLGGSGAYGFYWTIDSGRPANVVPELTGAVFTDANSNGHYDAGEGLPNVQITVAGVGTFPAYSTGGFDIPLAPGTYSVTASGPGLATPITKTVTIGSANVKLDFVAPTPGQWANVTSLPAGATYLSAATGSDGRIYVVGTPNTNPIDSGLPFGGAAAFSPSTSQWTTLADLPDLAEYVAAAPGGDGRIYAIGGLAPPTGGSGAYQATAEVDAWSPAAAAWQSVPNMPTPRIAAAAVMGADGRVYVFGGYQVGPSGGASTPVTTVDVYSPQSNSWSTPTSLPVWRTGYATVTGSDGRIYLIGGAPPGQGYPMARVDVYSPATNSWSQAADLPATRTGLAAALGPGGTIVAFGGGGLSDASSVYVYSPRGNVWTAAAPLPVVRSGLAGATGADGRIYAIGGSAFDNSSQRFQSLTDVEALTLPAPAAFVPGNLGQVAHTLTHSSESYRYFISQAYQHYLGRGTDSSGLSYWVDQMQNHGVTDERLEARFLGSAEYIANHGGTGEAWVEGMYHDLLGRAPDPQGLSYWVTKLQQGADPAIVAYGFAASAERETMRINADYQTYLGRNADPGGLSYWLNAFLHGSTNEDLVAGFAGSAEYFNAPNKGGGDPRQWIDAAFEDIFHRAATTQDEAYWLTVLQ